MNLSWIASVVFFGAYFVAYISNQLPHVLWVTVTAIAALVIAVLLVVDNHEVITHYTNRPPQQ